ncbi:endonuclease domain-containing protein [Streptosporangium saharense]|uniref:endonuclease domain-containing protein n=1 Tax=Streptosporangium saharense TaxID=1706840 RepID=UPI0036BC3ADF
MAQSWTELPARRVVWIRQPNSTALPTLPTSFPAIFPHIAGGGRAVRETVAEILDALEKAVTGLYPAWLPEAADLTGPGGLALPAVRELARRKVRGRRDLAAFLADLAARSLAAGTLRLPHRPVPVETRAEGLAMAYATSFGRPQTVVLATVPEGLSPAGEEALVAAGEWLTHRENLGLWLTGAPLRAVDRVPVLTIGEYGPAAPSVAGSVAVAGRPHPGSSVEAALERALSAHAWAAGRAWNQTYQPHPLVNPIKVDLLWQAERCVVELDGREHRGSEYLDRDRLRDERLIEDGYAVIRFTNERVLTDMPAVLRELKRFLRSRREKHEG